MTISTTIASVRYTGDASTVAFAFAFYAATGYLQVYKILKSTMVRTLQTETTDYTVSGYDTDGGGTVTFLSAPASTYYIEIIRVDPYTQLLDLVTQASFDPAALEAALDKIVRLIQQLYDKVDGPLNLPSYTVGALPSVRDEAPALIFVSDETGGMTVAFSDGTNWRRVQDRTIVA